MQVFYTVCMVTILWALYGYSLAFTGGSDFIGGFSKAFLAGVTPDSKAATFSVDANISELVYVCFQMTFAAITPALIVGAFAERMKFSAVALFIPAVGDGDLLPDRAHGLVLGRTGRDLGCGQGDCRGPAPTQRPRPRPKPSSPPSMPTPAGCSRRAPLDFAGGTVVHINAGIAGLVGALVIGKRTGYGKDLMAPHSLTNVHDRRLAALGGLVRIQRRLES